MDEPQRLYDIMLNEKKPDTKDHIGFCLHEIPIEDKPTEKGDQ